MEIESEAIVDEDAESPRRPDCCRGSRRISTVSNEHGFRLSSHPNGSTWTDSSTAAAPWFQFESKSQEGVRTEDHSRTSTKQYESVHRPVYGTVQFSTNQYIDRSIERRTLNTADGPRECPPLVRDGSPRLDRQRRDDGDHDGQGGVEDDSGNAEPGNEPLERGVQSGEWSFGGT